MRDRAVRQRPAAWTETGMARYRSDRSDATHREPDRNMKFSSRSAQGWLSQSEPVAQPEIEDALRTRAAVVSMTPAGQRLACREESSAG